MKGVCVLALLALGVGAAGQALTEHAPGRSSPMEPPAGHEATAPIHAALPALDRAYRAAVADGRWTELVELAGVVRRVGKAGNDPEEFDALALKIYESALIQARHQASLDGILRVAEGFGELADREDLRECVRIAELLAAGDREAEADVRDLVTRFSDLLKGDDGPG